MAITNSKVKDHYKTQLKRSKAYKRLLGMNIPDRDGVDKKKIMSDLWYIVWEYNIMKPKIFKYSFVTDIFAISFAQKHLSGKPFYICKGKDLKTFGVLKVDVGLRYTGARQPGTLPHKYDFPNGLSLQRKKTLRTMYRRNLRRLLMKLLKKKRKKMDKYVVDKIEAKLGAFFKKLKTQWYYELTYSKTFPEWYRREESWRIDEISKAAEYYPKYASEIANILLVLEKEYSDEKYDYKDHTYASLAINLWQLYKDRINRYMDKKGYKPKLGTSSPEEAWRELVYRGFVPYSLLPEPFNLKKDLYIKCFTGGVDLIYPKLAKNENDMALLQQRFGVTGFTGCNYKK